MKSIHTAIVAASSIVAMLPAYANVAPENSFVAGFTHPLGGMDHILAMVAVGVWGVLVGGRALWAWPAVFVATMLLGFLAAILGVSLPWTAAVIFASIVVLASMVAFAVQASVGLGAAIVGLFAFFHGHVHGTEATAASLPAYATGFTLATAGLHAAGIGLALAAQKSMGRITVRVLGVCALFGGLARIGG